MKSTPETPTSYRADIDALRALAVVLVLLFHGGAPFATGGFIGVDVFFVISGFLITSIITKQLQLKTFKITNFYISRIRRLVPALLVMVIVIAVLCYSLSLYDSSEFKSFRHSTRSALLFYSNIYFYLNTGYFDTPAITQVFLHTWSLGIEAQFYFIYPFILVFAYKKWNKHLAKIFLFATVVLYIASSIFVYFYPDAGFYLFPFRAWELFLGGWLALSNITPSQQKNKKYCVLLGIFLICLSAFVFNNLFTAHTPGFWALLPCAGAALVIAGGSSFSQRSLTHSLLQNKPILHIGLISYSLYLWHWPTFVIYRLISLEQHISFFAFLCLLVPICIFAHYSWKYIEQPIRKKLIVWPAPKQVTTFGACLLLCLFPTKFVKSPYDFFMDDTYMSGALDRCNFKNMSILGDKNQKTQFLVIGDSHAQAFACLFDSVANKKDISGRLIVGDGFINGKRTRAENYEEHNKLIKETIAKEKYSTIFLVSRWALGIKGYLPAESSTPNLDTIGFMYDDGKNTFFGAKAIEKSLIDTIIYLEHYGANQIYVFLPTPECGINIPKAAARLGRFFVDDEKINERLGVPRKEYTNRNKEVFQLLHSIENRFASVKLIDPCVFFYSDNDKSIVVKDGKSLYYDDDHLSITGSYMLGPLIEGLL